MLNYKSIILLAALAINVALSPPPWTALPMGWWLIINGYCKNICFNMVNFEWHHNKAELNLKKHGVSFDEAASAFVDVLSITYPDVEHSIHEERFLLIGT